jgi:hypothetical protein
VVVHHVEVDPVGAGGEDVVDFLAEAAKLADRMDGAMRQLDMAGAFGTGKGLPPAGGTWNQRLRRVLMRS